MENDKYPHIQVLLQTQKKDKIGKDEVVDVFGTINFETLLCNTQTHL